MTPTFSCRNFTARNKSFSKAAYVSSESRLPSLTYSVSVPPKKETSFNNNNNSSDDEDNNENDNFNGKGLKLNASWCWYIVCYLVGYCRRNVAKRSPRDAIT